VPSLLLSVDVLVPRVERVDVALGEALRFSVLAGEMDGTGDVLEQHGGLDGRDRVLADRERSVMGHQDSGGAGLAQGLDDPATDGVVADERERSDRDVTAELVGHHRQHAGNRLSPGRPRGGVVAVRVDDATAWAARRESIPCVLTMMADE